MLSQMAAIVGGNVSMIFAQPREIVRVLSHLRLHGGWADNSALSHHEGLWILKPIESSGYVNAGAGSLYPRSPSSTDRAVLRLDSLRR